MNQNKEKSPKNEAWLVISLMLVCCLGPILFIGMTGAWFSYLTGSEIVSFAFLAATLVFIGLGFRKLYFSGNCCQEDPEGLVGTVKQKQQMVFWLISALVLMLWGFFW